MICCSLKLVSTPNESHWPYQGSNSTFLGDMIKEIQNKNKQQDGPKGPGSLTWGKGQMSQWSHLQRTTNVVHQILVEDIKYESSGSCSSCSNYAHVVKIDRALGVTILHWIIFIRKTSKDFLSWTAIGNLTKLDRNSPWVVPYQNCSNGSDC